MRCNFGGQSSAFRLCFAQQAKAPTLNCIFFPCLHAVVLFVLLCGKLMRMSTETADKKGAPTYEPVGYIDLLRRNRAFRQLWLGQVVSQMGDWFNTIALYTIILNLTGSGRDVGLLLVARFLPSFLFGPLSGVVADRFSRQRIMIISDLLRALVVLGFLFVRTADQLWIVYVLTVLQLGLATFFEPAKTAAIPSIV
ncbi:MAG TPA: MFS transporter, partial [Pyrinomonadaceae bacterium]|nr:MFS transporter [Pyrinomonadaceae bacterium]